MRAFSGATPAAPERGGRADGQALAGTLADGDGTGRPGGVLSSEDGLRTILGIATDLVMVLDGEGRVLEFASSHHALAGELSDDLVGKTLHVLLPREQAEEHLRSVRRALETREVQEIEYCREIAGRPIWFAAKISALRGDAVVWAARDITERRRRELDLRAAEKRYRMLVEQAPLVIYTENTGSPTEVTYVSPQVEGILGHSPQEFAENRQLWMDSIHPEDRERVMLEDRRADESGEPFALEYRTLTKDGRTRWVREQTVPVKDGAGETLYWQGFMWDITGRKEAEQALKENEAKYRSLVEQLPALIYVEAVDEGTSETNFLYISPQHENLLGYPPEEWMSDKRFWETLIHPDDRERVVAEDERTDQTGEPFRVEYRYIARDGSIVWVRDDAVLVRDEDGTPLFWQGVMYDITEQKRVEEELRLRDRAMTATPNGIVISDPRQPDNPIIYVNPAFERITGYGAEEAIGRNCRFLQGTDRDQPGVIELGAAIRAGREARVVLRNYRKGGEMFWNQLNLAPVRDAQGSVTHYIGVQTDVTERVRAEEEIRQLNEGLENRIAERTAQLRAYAEQLQLSNRELQEFAYVASHDLQEPLRKVLAFGDRLRRRHAEALGDRGLDYLGRMEDAAQRMQGLIEDLLALSRVTTRARPFGPVDLGEVVRGVVSDLEAALEESGGRIRVGELPTIYADRAQMRQLFQNLIGNALKFRKPGEAPLVEVRAEVIEERRDGGGAKMSPDERLCRITVEDNGIGFDEQYIGRIFTPFERLHARDAYEGTGMGLAICRKVVERHGGTINAKSAPDHGSRFVVTLPVKQGEGAGAPGRT